MMQHEFIAAQYVRFFKNAPKQINILRGGAFAIFLLAYFWANGQNSETCLAPMCQSLQIEIIPRYSSLDVNCSMMVDSDCKDLSRQMVYDVYLVDNSLTPPFESYDLDYADLYMEVKLVVSNPSTNPRSRISYASTTSCNEQVMSQWTGEIFSITPENGKVSLSLSNNSNDCASDVFMMELYQPDPINDKPIRRAKLYEVVVDAYPGETFSLQCGELVYYARSSIFCPDRNGSGGNAIACNSSANYTVPMPNTNSGANSDIRAVLNVINNGNGTANFVVSLQNLDGFFSKTVNYFDFFANFDFSQIMDEPIVSSVYLTETIATGSNGINRTYRFTGENISLSIPAAGAVAIATITITGPEVNNLCWNVTMSLPQDNTARVRTNGNCSGRLSLSTASAPFAKSTDCENSCAGNDQADVGFAVTSEQNFTNCGVKIKLGLTNLNPDPSVPAVINLESLDIRVQFVTTGTLVLTGFQLGEYTCSTSSCANIPTPTTFSFYNNWGNAYTPLDLNTAPVITLLFEGSGCVSEATVTRLSLKLKVLDPCVPTIATPDLSLGCSPAIRGKIWAYVGSINVGVGDTIPAPSASLEDATVLIKPTNITATCPSNCAISQITPISGEYGACVCSGCASYSIIPSQNLDQQNGVTAWDLILISRHILGLEPLDTPYKLIGADANKDDKVSTFDIVELRKLLLGTYQVLPAITSWRIVDKKQVFINPANPFADVIRESVTGVTPGNLSIDFIGVKIGDVDHSAVPNNRPAFQQELPFSVGQETVSAKSEFITLPITYQGDQSLEAVQMGLHFDPTYLEFVAPSQGNIEGITPDCFGLQQVKQGNIALLWLYNPISNEHRLQAGDQLCYLTFKVLQPLPENGDWLQLGDQILSSTAWDSQGAIYRPVVPATVAERTASARLSSNKTIQVTAIPNPTHGAVQLQIDGGAGIERAKVGLFDAFGKVVLVRNLRIAPGQQTLDLPELVAQPAGVYNWRIWSETMQVSGIIVKQ